MTKVLDDYKSIHKTDKLLHTIALMDKGYGVAELLD